MARAGQCGPYHRVVVEGDIAVRPGRIDLPAALSQARCDPFAGIAETENE
jgi:hypothetical protein